MWATEYKYDSIIIWKNIQLDILITKKRSWVLKIVCGYNNKPAIMFYEKNGFKKVEEIFNTYLTDDTVLYEYGYAMKL